MPNGQIGASLLGGGAGFLGQQGLLDPQQRSGLGQFFLGAPERIQQIERFTPEQQSALGMMLQQALGQLQDPQAGFAPIAQEARRGFEQQTLPTIAERFTGMGGQRSSAFGQQLGAAGAGLESQLAALGAQFGQQQQGLAQQLAQLGLTPQFESLLRPRTPGLLEQLLPMALKAGSAFATGGASLAGGL